MCRVVIGGTVMVIENISVRLRVNIAALLGIFFSAYLNAIVTAISPDMIVAFKDGTAYYALSWNLFYLFGAIAMPLSGRLSLTFGKKRLFIVGILLCILGTLCATLVISMAQFALTRCIIGAGYGIILSVGVAVLGEINPPESRAKYMAMYSTMVGLSQMAFPPLASLVASFASWRLVFAFGVILGIIPAIMLQRNMPSPLSHQKVSIDWRGIVLLSLCCAAIVLALTGAGHFLSGLNRGHFIIAAIVFLLLFLKAEQHSPCPVIPLTLFKNKHFLFCAVAVFGLYIAFYPLNTFKTLLGTGVLQLDPVYNSLLMSVQFVGMCIFSILSGQLVSRTGKLKLITVLALLVTLLGFGGLIVTGMATSPLFVGVCYFFIGAGTGHLVYAFTLFLQNSLPVEIVAIAIGTTGFLQKVGGTLGNAFSDLAFETHWIHTAEKVLSSMSMSEAQCNLLKDYAFLLSSSASDTAMQAFSSFSAEEVLLLFQHLRQTFAIALHRPWIVCASGLILCFLMVLLLPNDKKDC